MLPQGNVPLNLGILTLQEPARSRSQRKKAKGARAPQNLLYRVRAHRWRFGATKMLGYVTHVTKNLVDLKKSNRA